LFVVMSTTFAAGHSIVLAWIVAAGRLMFDGSLSYT